MGEVAQLARGGRCKDRVGSKAASKQNARLDIPDPPVDPKLHSAHFCLGRAGDSIGNFAGMRTMLDHLTLLYVLHRAILS